MAACVTWFILLPLTGLVPAVSSTPVTCKADICSEGEPAFVTCLFHKDISVSKPGINVLRYRLNASSISEETDVLQCIWPKDRTSPECIVETGYNFDNVISDRLTLEVPSASETVAGLYICHVVPQGDFHPHACDLIVTDQKRQNPSSTGRPDDATPITNDKDTDCSGALTALAVTAGLCVLLVFAVVFMVVYLKLRRRTQTQVKHRGETFSEDTENLLQGERCTSTGDIITAEVGDRRDITTGVQYPVYERPSYMKVNNKAVTLYDQNKNLLSLMNSEKAHTEGIPFSDPSAPGMCNIMKDKSGQTKSVQVIPEVPEVHTPNKQSANEDNSNKILPPTLRNRLNPRDPWSKW